MRLIDQLISRGMSRSDAKRALQSGKVFVSGVPSALAVREVEGSEVEVRPNAARVRPGDDLVILHHTPDYVVVWKPAGLLSTPAPDREQAATVLSKVKAKLGSGLAVHRLDEFTSGLMLVALTKSGQQHLKDELANRKISRAYLALVAPQVRKGWRLEVENILVRDRGDGRRGSGSGAEGKRAVTHLRELARVGSVASLVEARLETGRTHQIRIHLSESGHPVLGDKLYGPRRGGGIRLALHAYSMSFVDPAGVPQRFEVPLPDDMAAFIQRDGRSRSAPVDEERGRDRRDAGSKGGASKRRGDAKPRSQAKSKKRDKPSR